MSKNINKIRVNNKDYFIRDSLATQNSLNLDKINEDANKILKFSLGAASLLNGDINEYDRKVINYDDVNLFNYSKNVLGTYIATPSNIPFNSFCQAIARTDFSNILDSYKDRYGEYYDLFFKEILEAVNLSYNSYIAKYKDKKYENNFITVQNAEPEYSDDGPQIKNYVDSHQVYFKVISNNYEPYEGSYNLEVTQLEAELSWGDSNWIYDGDSHQTICKVSNLVEGDECDVILKNNVISNIDSIDVEVIELTNSNYKLPNNTKHTITISPGFFIKQSGNWFPVKKVYKRVSGTWVLQDMQSETRKSVFDVNKTYVNSENL